ncbi:fam11a b protein [Anaeramoeba flamelloides]|uniref:Fam11a b protein n=1 Tax=Anaeramoeba flamelloides TaxID=1746091 RepID=A0AAV7Y947_9EUKA|nr:fam11a b protein [Anaeramoeba flamelloides]
MVRMVCTIFEIATRDQELWRKICFQYHDLFIWTQLIVPKDLYYFQDTPIYGIQDDLIYKLTGKLSTIKEKLSHNLSFSVFPWNRQAPSKMPITCKRIRIEYIKQHPDPEMAIIGKIKKIKNSIKEKELQNSKNSNIETKYRKKDDYNQRIKRFLELPSIFLLYAIIPFTIMLHLWIDKYIDIDIFWVFSPFIFVFILGFISMTIATFVSCSKFNFWNMIVYYFAFFVLIVPFTTVVFKITGILKCNYLTVFSPLIVIIGLMILAIVYVMTTQHFDNFDCFVLTFQLFATIFCSLLLVFIFYLSLKLDNQTSKSWPMIFSPLIIADFIPCLIPLSVLIFRSHLPVRNELCVSLLISIASFVILIPFIIFQILLILFLEGEYIKIFALVMIPVYIFDVVIFIIATLLLFGRFCT